MTHSNLRIVVVPLLILLLGSFQDPFVRAESPNLVANGSFEVVEGEQAQSWRLSSAQPELFKLSFPKVKERGHIAEMKVLGDSMSGYFNQKITLKPHTNYRLSASCKLDQGKILIQLHGSTKAGKVGARVYVMPFEDNPLLPYFWDKKWIQGKKGYRESEDGTERIYRVEMGEWVPVSIDFNSGELTSASLSLGAYFKVGTYQFDEVSLVELPSTK